MNGTIGSKVFERNLTKGWTMARPFHANYKKHMLLYKSSTGDASIYKINNNGSLGKRTYNSRWTKGWTTAEFKGSNHQQYIFLMKYKDGKIKQHFITAAGSLGDTVFDNKLKQASTGWSDARFFTTDTQRNYVLLMNKKTGAVVINKVHNN